MNTNPPVIVPLMHHIENSSNKWPCVPSEYENLKEYYSCSHSNSLEGYDEWFNNNFRVLTSEEIQLREERIQKREDILKEIRELNTKLNTIEKRKSDITTRLNVLKERSDNLLDLINFEVEV